MAQNKRQEEHWSEKRRRRVRCKIHGLHFDPEMTSGCALCRKEGLLQEEARRSRPQLVFMLLALLGVAVSAYRIFGPGLGGGIGALENDGPALEIAESSLLPPAPYRAQLEAVDRAIFAPTASNMLSIGSRIDVTLEALGRSLSAAASLRSRRAASQIQALRENRDLWISAAGIAELRRQWLELRSRTFDQAPWFHFIALERGLDRVTTVAYRDATDDLLDLIEEAAAHARGLTASVAGPFGVSEESRARIAEEWTSFLAEWQRRLGEIAQRLPPRPASGAETGLLLAAQRFEAAMSVARSLARAAQPPPEATFDRAFELTEEARRSFEDLAP